MYEQPNHARLAQLVRASRLHREGRGFESLSAHPSLLLLVHNVIVSSHMANTVTTSPVDMEARKTLDIRPGDTVRVWQKIEEKGKIRLQAFEGLVLARKHGREAGGTFTVRRVASGVGVEKVFPLYTPMIDRVEIVKRSRVRRAKLYFIRDKAARESRRQLRRSKMMDTRVTSDVVNKEKAAALEKAAKEAVEVKTE